MGSGSIGQHKVRWFRRFAIVGAAVLLAATLSVPVGSCGGGTAETTATTPTSAGASTSAPNGAQVVLKDFAFDPATVTVKVGEIVTWTNQDSANHTVVGDNGEFESGDLAIGASFAFAFDRPGVYPYHCSIHPSMKATVVVE